MRLLLSFLCTLFITQAMGQTYNERVAAYLSTYNNWAMAEQQRTGIPASITLAQGVLETNAGSSLLATEANNHFGIKCRKEWTGETYTYTDDRPDECFRKYKTAYDSYRDHSDYLMGGTRYQSCFVQSVTDYSAWAHHLKKCGYATNPKYAAQLIKIVENFNLQDYTLAALKTDNQNTILLAGEVVPTTEIPEAATTEMQSVVADKADVVIVEESQSMTEPVLLPTAEKEIVQPEEDKIAYDVILKKNGLKGFYAHKGDVLLEYAIKQDIRYARLLELNDLPDAPLSADMFIYLEKKMSKGLRTRHIVQPNESLIQIAQAEGMQLKQLRSLNQLEVNEEPRQGIALNLQTMVSAKPAVFIVKNEEANQFAQTPKTTASAYVPTHVEKMEVLKEVTEVKVVERVKAEQVELPKPTKTAIKTSEPIIVAANNNIPKAERIVAVETKGAPKPAAVKAYNIASEKAVGESRPIAAPATVAVPVPKAEPAAPVSDFDRLKNKLDAMVYSNAAEPPPVKTLSAKTKEIEVKKSVNATTSTAAVPASSQAAYHIVKAGETAYAIAKKYGLGTQELMSINNMEGFQALKVGQKLMLK